MAQDRICNRPGVALRFMPVISYLIAALTGWDMKLYEGDNPAFNYAKEHGTIGLDYDAIYDAFKAGMEWTEKKMKKQDGL